MIDPVRQRIANGEIATMDFETRSECDLKKHGAWVYSKHPSTEALCLSYKLPGKPTKTWHMGHEPRTPWNEDAPEHRIEQTEDPTDLFEWIALGGLVEAHNAFFERVIWTHVMVVKHGWPELKPENLRCSASKASASALPRSLEQAAKAMNLPVEKDMEGRRLMLKMTKPRKPRKAEKEAWKKHCIEEGFTNDNMPDHPVVWYETEEAIFRNHEYCERDVETEEAFSHACPDLSQRELYLWQMDQAINWFGVRTDVPLAVAALKRAAEAKLLLAEELQELIGIEKPSQRTKIKQYLIDEGLEIPDTTAGTIDYFLENYDFENEVHRRVLEIVKAYNRTSVRKYQAIIDKTDPTDMRARDILMYHGASTGRWSGRGIQVQNFPRGNAINDHYWNKKAERWDSTFNMDKAVRDIKDETLDTATLALMYGDIMEFLSSALRGAIQPSNDNKVMIVADYSAIEARCVLWEAGAEAALEVFRSGGDIYCDMAEGIYGYPVNKKDHPKERQFGKQAILGLGYGMGYITFLLTCRMYKIIFGKDQVMQIVGEELYDKYADWIDRNLLRPTRKNVPKVNEDTGETEWVPEPEEDFKRRKAAAAKKRKALMEARVNPRKSIHELVLMKYTVEVYRKRYPEVPAMWRAQEKAAIEAIKKGEEALLFDLDLEDISPADPEWDEYRNNFKGPVVEEGKFKWFMEGGFLCCELPSGRLLRYRDAFLKTTKTEWGESKPSIRYYTVVLGSKWARTSTYGGKIVENQTQAVARDVMADAMLDMIGVDDIANDNYNIYELMEESEYRPLMTVHDEIVAECAKISVDKDDFEAVMCAVGPWADGCPITAEADTMARYRK